MAGVWSESFWGDGFWGENVWEGDDSGFGSDPGSEPGPRLIGPRWIITRRNRDGRRILYTKQSSSDG